MHLAAGIPAWQKSKVSSLTGRSPCSLLKLNLRSQEEEPNQKTNKHVDFCELTRHKLQWFKAVALNLFWHQGPVSGKTIFPWTGKGGRVWGEVGEMGFGMIQVHYIYYALYF